MVNEFWKEAKCFDCEAANCSSRDARRLEYYNVIGSAALPGRQFDNVNYLLFKQLYKNYKS